MLQEIKKLQKSGESSQILELCEQTLQEQSSIFCDLNYLVVQILDCAMDSCIALQLWEKALAYGLRTLEAYRRFYPEYHPSTGIQLFRIGKILYATVYNLIVLAPFSCSEVEEKR